MAGARADARIFHGWWVVLAGFVCTLLTIGSTTYAFGLFVQPMADEFGLSRADINSGFIFLLVGFALWAPLVGRLLDAFPVRPVMLSGAFAFVIGFAAIAAARSPWIMGLAIILPVSFGAVACGALAANTVTARWFHVRRGRAMGLLAVSTSVGGFTMPPLIAVVMDAYGWRQALLLQGLLCSVLMGAAVLWLVRGRPSDLGLTPDGLMLDGPAKPQGASSTENIWSFASLLKARNFWMVSLGAGILLAADQALLASMIPYGMDAGLGLKQASLLMSCLTFSAILGKLGIGALADRVDKRLLFCAVAACNLGFLVVLLLQPGYVMLLAACSIIGLAIGGTYPLWMTLTADCFGARSFGTVMGSMNLVVMPFAIVAVRFIGTVFDRTGSYDQAFQVFMATAVMSTLLILAVRPPARDNARGG